MKKKVSLKIILSFLLIVFTSLLGEKNVSAANAGSRKEAVDWVYAQEGKYLDYDGAYGAQCVDLIQYYYAYFGKTSYAVGNACKYVTNNLPDGWIRIQNTSDFVPEPGDIAVWGTELNETGHVSIVLSANKNSFVSMDQNWPRGSYCKQVSHSYGKFWGVIRPNFDEHDSSGSSDSHVDVGTDFYAYLINTATWLHATNDDSGNVCVRNLKNTSDQIWYFERQSDGSYRISSCKDGRCMEVHNFETANGTNVEMNGWNGNTAQRWFIYGNSGQYKLKAACGNNALDLYGGADAAHEGSNLDMWEDNGTTAQRFSIWGLDKPKLGTTVAVVENYGDTDGNNVKISWSACDNATGYDVRVWDENGENILQTFWNVQGTSCFAKLSSGNYRIKITTLNNQFNIWKDGEFRNFSCSNNIGSSFYAYLINTATWLHATNDSGNVVMKSLRKMPDQIWHFELQNDGSYKIVSSDDGRCLTVHNSESGNGTNVEVSTWNGNASQRWFIYGSSGQFKLKAACGNNALDMYGGEEAAYDGINLNMWEDNDSSAQKFSIWGLDDIKDSIMNADVRLQYTNCIYTGEEKTPQISIQKNSIELMKDVDFKVSYSDNLNVGTATITIIGMGNYTGKIVKNFEIKKADQILKISVSKNNLLIGESIQIQYSGIGDITFKSTDEEKMIINDSGVITGKKAGMATIVVTASGDSNYNSCTKEITINIQQNCVNGQHVWDEGTITSNVTCTHDGIKTYTCKTCKASKIEVIPATGHQASDLCNVKEATCLEAGYTGDIYCKICNTQLQVGTVIPQKQHIWDNGDITKEPTCVDDGLKKYTCTLCKTIKTEIVSALGHQHIELRNKKEPTCTQEGYTGDEYCIDCRTIVSSGLSIHAKGHKNTIVKFAKMETCQSEGYSGDIYCQECGDLLEEGHILPKLEHVWDNETIVAQASCTSDGLKTFTCTLCKQTKTEKITATGHVTTEIDNHVEATCTTEGYTGDVICTTCGQVVTKGTKILKSDHIWDNGTIVKEASTTETGVRVFICQKCGLSKTEAIDKLEIPKLTFGTIVKDPSSNGIYRILEDGISLEFVKPIVKKASVKIPETITINGITCKIIRVATNAFKNNKIVRTISIGCNVTDIGGNAFYGCKNLKKITGGNAIIQIGNKAFYNCGCLLRITIPNSVTKIGRQAFYNCRKLKTIIIKTTKLTNRSIGAGAFIKVYEKVSIRIPAKQMKQYKKLFKAKGMSSKASYKK